RHGIVHGDLAGRRTYQEFAPAWSGRTAAEDPGAPFMNESPKYVVSATLQAGDWQNSTILGPYNPDTIRGPRTESPAASTSAAAAPWFARFLPTAWSTSCTCSCSRWPRAPVSDCSPTAARPSSSPWLDRRPTATEHCT